MRSKRCSLYSYSTNGNLDRYAIVAIKELKKISYRVLVVVNGKVTSRIRQFITETLGVELLERENQSHYFYSYEDGINYLGFENIKQYDELVLLNSSVYGPIKSLSRCFEKMEDRDDVDFWGMTKNTFDSHEYIQSYFYVFKRKVLVDESFKDLWKNLHVTKKCVYAQQGSDEILLEETRLTKYLCDRGFNFDSLLERNYNLYSCETLDGAYHSLKDTYFPFVKRNLFTDGYFQLWNKSSPSVARRTFDLLSEEWKNIILDDLLKNQPQSKWKLALQNSLVIDDKCVGQDETVLPTCAAIFFVWFEDNIKLILKYALNLPKKCDIYFVSPKNNILTEYKNKLKFEKDRKIVFRTQPNRGRNESCYWVRCRDVIETHECVCLIHDKKVVQLKPLNQGLSFFEFQLENLLYSKSYIERLIKEFNKNIRIGLVQPPLPVFGPWAGSNVLSPTTDPNNVYGNTENCKKILGINLPLDPDLPFPVGGSFWIRSDAFKLLLEKKLTYEDFPEEPLPHDGTFNHALERIYPLIAQQSGFMTVDAMTINYSIMHKNNLELYVRLNQKNICNGSENQIEVNSHESCSWNKIFRIIKSKLKYSIKKRIRKKTRNEV